MNNEALILQTEFNEFSDVDTLGIKTCDIFCR